jgi:formylglycine-generating enzyme required for sulfatase activity
MELTQGLPALQIQGSAGQWVQVQSQPALDSPAQWQTLDYMTLNQGTTIYTNGLQNTGTRFYRVVLALASPSDTFLMGSASSEDGRDSDEGPQTTVTLTNAFWMAPQLVTQGEYLAVMGTNPSSAAGDTNRPVEMVSWNDAQSYCQALTQQEHSAGRIPASLHYRLPTEAEWEYAARAGTTNRFYFGDDPNYALLGNYAWFTGNSDSIPHPVGTKKPNPWGLSDMAGNVLEWCQDWYGNYPGGSQTNPGGRPTGTERVVRGGSWYSDGWLCRSAARNSFPPATKSPQIGFRVVLSPD